MSEKRLIGIKIFGISLLIWSFICGYVSLINIFSIGRPLSQHSKYLIVFPDSIIIVQNALYFIMNILFFMNSIHILKLISGAIKELFILIIISIIIHFVTDFLITQDFFQILKDFKFIFPIWLIALYYFTRPNIKACFNKEK